MEQNKEKERSKEISKQKQGKHTEMRGVNKSGNLDVSPLWLQRHVNV
jgi:hypothetical protein